MLGLTASGLTRFRNRLRNSPAAIGRAGRSGPCAVGRRPVAPARRRPAAWLAAKPQQAGAVAKAGPGRSLPASPSTPRGRPTRTCLSRIRPASSRHAGELAGAAGQHDAPAGDPVEAGVLRRARTISKVSSMRGRMMPTSIERGTLRRIRRVRPRRSAARRSSRASSDGDGWQLPYSVLIRSAWAIGVDRPRASRG